MGLEQIMNITSGIQALFTNLAESPASAKRRELIERAIKMRVHNISRIEVQSPTAIAIFSQVGCQMVCREFQGSASRVKNLVQWSQALNAEIRVRYV